MKTQRLLFLSCMILLTTGASCGIRLVGSPASDGGIFRSTDFGDHWEQKVFVRQEKKKVLTISAEDIDGIFFSPHNADELMITTFAHGIYRSQNNGDSWEQTRLTSGHFTALSFDPTNSAMLYTAIGPQVLKTATAGETWNIIYTEARGEEMTALAVDPEHPERIYAATRGGTILQSVNYGIDWNMLTDINAPIHALEIVPTATSVMYAVTDTQGVYRTTDTGQHWEPLVTLTKFPGANQVNQLLVTRGEPSLLFAATDFGLLKSVDAGLTWEPIKTLVPFKTLPIRTVAVDTNNHQLLYFTVNNLVHKSEDGGKTWRTIGSVPTSRLLLRLRIDPQQNGTLFLGTWKQKK